MNRVILCGRLTKDPEVRYSAEGTGVARYSLAVDRYTKQGNETDFISCVAFGKNAEFAEKYLAKGMKILVEGRIQTGSYTTKDGQKVYATDVVIDRHEFCEKKGTAAPAKSEEDNDIPPGFEELKDDNLPF